MTEFTLTDVQGATLDVQTGASASGEQRAHVETGSGLGVWVLPHQVPAVCRALYEAAGLPVPDLPDIPDPALVEVLAEDLVETDPCSAETFDMADIRAQARALLAKGWGRAS